MDNNKVCFLLPVKDLVVFPKSLTSILVGRKKSLNLIDEIIKTNELIFVVF